MKSLKCWLIAAIQMILWNARNAAPMQPTGFYPLSLRVWAPAGAAAAAAFPAVIVTQTALESSAKGTVCP